MGNIDSRAKQKKGYLFVQTEKSWYYEGEDVKGTIYIRAEEDCPEAKVQFKIKGVEKCGFSDREGHWEGEGE